MSLDLRHLRAFIAVAENRSIGRGAEALNVSQPALSRMIRNLESNVETPLFDRHARGMALTEFGQALLPRALLLVAEATSTLDEIAALQGMSRGNVRVGAISSVIEQALPRAVNRLAHEQPGLHFTIVEASGEALVLALLNRTVDLVIAAELPPHVDITSIGPATGGDQLRVVASAQHPLAGRSALAPSALLGVRWALIERPAPPRKQFDEKMREMNLPDPDIMFESRSINAVKALVSTGSCLGWLPDTCFIAELAAGRLVSLDVTGFQVARSFTIYRRRQGLLSVAARGFLAALRFVDNGKDAGRLHGKDQ